MNKDELMFECIKQLCEETQDFIHCVNTIGNQCAYTDRIIEKIIATSESLKGYYSED